MSTTIQIEVPDALVAAVTSGSADAIKQVREAGDKLREALKVANKAIDNPVARTIANGLAREKGVAGAVTMQITASGSLVVSVETQADGKTTKANGKAKKANGKKGRGSNQPVFPTIGELRARADKLGVDITGFKPQAKREILAALDAAETKGANGKKPPVAKADPQPVAASV